MTGHLRYGSLFTGVGGFDLGFDRAGMVGAWQAEQDPKCLGVLEQHWPGVTRYDDVRKVDGSARRVDLVCGGFPCQDISVAGRRRGLAGERSGLWWEFHRVLAELAPRWVVIENVPGLLSSNDGRDMGAILGALGDLGYGFAYRVLDSQWTRVAQRRRRVFIVGHLGDRRAAQVLLEPEGVPGHPPTRRQAGTGAAVGVAACLNSGGNDGGFRTEPGEHLVHGFYPHTSFRDGLQYLDEHAPAITVGSGLGIPSPPGVCIAYQCHGSNVGEMGTLRSGNGHVTGGVPFIPFDTTQITSALNRSAPKPDDPCRPLAAGAHPPAIAGTAVRRLTPRECERLQGFPDDWTAQVKDSHRYRMMGNAVTVTVAEWIGRRIVAAEHVEQAA